MKKNAFYFLGFLLALLITGDPSAAAEEPQAPVALSRISSEAFINSEASQSFRHKDYPAAVKGYEQLIQKYPRDITLRRYLALSYEAMGQYEKALGAYEQALSVDRSHAATRYYRGLTLFRVQKDKEAREDLAFVVQADPEGSYGRKAKKMLLHFDRGKSVKLKEKKWTFLGRAGWVYDTNVILAPKEKGLRNANADLNDSRYDIEGNLHARLYQKDKIAVTGEYGFLESLNDDGQKDLNYHLERGALAIFKDARFLRRYWRHSLRHDLEGGWLDHAFFSVINTTTLGTSTSFWDRTLNSFFARYGYQQFAFDGANPDLQSRDGSTEGAGLSMTFYDRKRIRSVTAGYGWDAAQTRGRNYDSTAHSVQLSARTPLAQKLFLDILGSYRDARYYHFDGSPYADTSRRRDHAYSLSVYLSYSLTPSWTLRGNYRFFDTESDNEVFANQRQLFGVDVLFRY